jgi:hypothetical protein
LLGKLEIGRALLDAKGLCLVGTRHHAAVVVRLFLNFDYSEYSL